MPQVSILNHNVGDAVRAFHKTFLTDKNKVIDLSRDYRNHYFGKLEKNRLEYRSKDGKSFHVPYLVNGYSNVVLDSFFNPESINRQDLGAEATVYWTWQKTHFAVDRREPGWGSSSSPSMIYNYLKLQTQNMFSKYYDENERFIWTVPPAPNDGADSQVAPWSINYWVRKFDGTAGTRLLPTGPVGANGIACEATGGHGVSSAGLSRIQYSQLANYTARSAAMSQNDFVDKACEMLDMMQWKAPRPEPMEVVPEARYEMVSGYAPFKEYQKLTTASNDNLGSDVAKYRPGLGTVQFRGVTWSWTDALTRTNLPDGSANSAFDANLPVYFLDWSTWNIFAAQGWYQRMDAPIELDAPHNLVVQWMDTAYQLFCHNPRGNGVIITA